MVVFLPAKAEFMQGSRGDVRNQFTVSIADRACASAAAAIANEVIQRREHGLGRNRHLLPLNGTNRLGSPSVSDPVRADRRIERTRPGKRLRNAFGIAYHPRLIAHAGLDFGADVLGGQATILLQNGEKVIDAR
ncbi:hypothetical protein D3C78_1252710 [compost metagenome]